MSIAGPNYHSRVFGFNTFKFATIAILLVITAFFFWQSNLSIAVILAVVALIIAAFNIAVDASSRRIKISVLWIPLKTIDSSEIKGIDVITDVPFLERATLGIHAIDGSWSYHSGPATVRISTHDGKRIRVSAQNPETLLKLVDNSVPTTPESSRT